MIKIPDKKLKSIRYYSPLLLYMALLIIFHFTATSDVPFDYLNMSNKDIARLNLALFTYGLPIFLLVTTTYEVIFRFNVYKYKITPPPNIPVLSNPTPKIPVCPVCYLIISIIILFLTIYMVYFGHGVYNEIINAKNT